MVFTCALIPLIALMAGSTLATPLPQDVALEERHPEGGIVIPVTAGTFTAPVTFSAPVTSRTIFPVTSTKEVVPTGIFNGLD